MKFLKFKKVLCTAVSFALLVAVLPATIASADLDSAALTILDEDYFEGTDVRVSDLTIDNPKGATGIVSLAEDPEDGTNQVIKLTSKGTATPDSEAANFNISTYYAANTHKMKYSDLGYDANRPVIYEMDMYIPKEAVRGTNGENITGYYGIHVGPHSHASGANRYYRRLRSDGYALDYGINGQNNKGVLEEGKFTYALNRNQGNPQFTTDDWHTFKWIISAGGTKISAWIDDTLVAENVTTKKTLTGNRYFDGIKVAATYEKNLGSTALPEGVSLYIDNVKIYQVKADFAGQFSYAAADSVGTLTLNHAITEADLANITVADSTGNAVTPLKSLSTDGKVVTLSFGNSLQLGETYTVSAESLTDIYGLSLAESSFTFTEVKSQSVALKTANITATPSSTGAAASLVLENGAASRDVYVVMAVYGQYNVLLGVDAQTITVDGTTQPITFETTDNCEGATLIKVFVWDGSATMVPLQNSEPIWTSGN